MNSNIGDRIGDYEIVGVLGAGGMGKVYKVRNVISDRIEAMKVLLPDLANVPELADRFMREIKVLAGLEHPNIAALRTAQRVDNQLIMVMELVEGVTLQDRLEQGRLPVPEALEYSAQVLSALSYAHARGVIHRDIKPANMMVTAGGIGQTHGFRHRQSRGRPEAHHDRNHPGLALLHVSGADQGRRVGRAFRSLLVRHLSLRNRDRGASVPR